MDSLHAFSDIKNTLGYLAPEYIEQVESAFQFAKKSHGIQMRVSGCPYISHPLAVAKILGELKLDHHTVIAGLLHDVVEDTPVTLEEIISYFGEDIGSIVDGVTKISSLKYKDVVKFQAENYRKMFMAMAQDVRVVFVKLADRLHNMRTCQVMSNASKRRIAKETLEVYAPIAKRLGMHNLSQELFELGFAARFPIRYAVLLEHMYQVNSGQADVLASLSQQIQTQAKAQGIQALEVSFREKQLYGIYQKMIQKRATFSKLMDVYALRICVATVAECYHLLGIVHSLYRPKERQLKDYIAAPKPNGYQSIHTVLYGPYDMPIEIQIRTSEMHLVATKGVAAHWIYKSGASTVNQQKQQEWFKRLVEAQSMCSEDAEYLKLVKHQVYSEEVYVLTPKGKVLELKQGATVLDMAYSIHTDVGNHSVYAEVDTKRAPLNQVLRNGQTVKVFTDTESQPSPSWLDIVVSTKAKTAIKHFLREKSIVSDRKIGMQILRAGLIIRGFEGRIGDVVFDRIANDMGYQNPNKLYESLVTGEERVELVINRCFEALNAQQGKKSSMLVINQDNFTAVKMSKCCHPVSGDRAVAITSRNGHEVHRSTCRTSGRINDPKILVQWDSKLAEVFPCYIRVVAFKESTNLAYIISVISDMQAKTVGVVMNEQDREECYILKILVRSVAHLTLVIQSLKQVKSIYAVSRENKCESLSLEQG